jgi:hypothetical protein
VTSCKSFVPHHYHPKKKTYSVKRKREKTGRKEGEKGGEGEKEREGGEALIDNFCETVLQIHLPVV